VKEKSLLFRFKGLPNSSVNFMVIRLKSTNPLYFRISENTEKLLELYNENAEPCNDILAKILNVSLMVDIFLEKGI